MVPGLHCAASRLRCLTPSPRTLDARFPRTQIAPCFAIPPFDISTRQPPCHWHLCWVRLKINSVPLDVCAKPRLQVRNQRREDCTPTGSCGKDTAYGSDRHPPLIG